MKLIQYSILLLLVINGLSPWVDGNTIQDNCDVEVVNPTDNDSNEGEKSSSEGLVTPDKEFLHEPKPNDLSSGPSKALHGCPFIIALLPFSPKTITLTDWDSIPKICDDIKEHCHYSKRLVGHPQPVC